MTAIHTNAVTPALATVERVAELSRMMASLSGDGQPDARLLPAGRLWGIVNAYLWKTRQEVFLKIRWEQGALLVRAAARLGRAV
jgi:hypothetical protein